MKVYQGINEFQGVKRPILTIGTFDGVHKGHKAILDRLKKVARDCGGESTLLTFFPHPRMVLAPDSDLKLIQTMDEKAKVLRDEGVEHLIIQPFTREFAGMDPSDYVQQVLVEGIGMEYLVIGYDHRFGKGRVGDIELLREMGPKFGFEVEEIPPELVNDVDVSSTKVRNALLEGDVRTARAYLDRPFSLEGKVVKGTQKGRELGFPTANIQVEESYKMIPADGVYAVEVDHQGEVHHGMLNVGVRPTFDGQKQRSIEVHIFGIDTDLYDSWLTVRFMDRIRDEKEFDGPEDLKEQLEQDRIQTKKVLDPSG